MRLVQYRPIERSKGTLHGRRVAIVGEPGRKWIKVVIADQHLTVLEVPLDEQRFMEDIDHLPRIKVTPIQSVARRLLKRGNQPGCSITDDAKALLKRAASVA